MANIPIVAGDYFRGVAKEARILVKNRYFEQNPVLTEENATMLARPGMRKWTTVGDSLGNGIRGIYSQPGTFNDDVFVAVGEQLWRLDIYENKTLIGQLPTGLRGPVTMAATANIGDVPEFLFVASGGTFFVYVEDGFARNTLAGTTFNNGDQVRIGSTYYQMTSGSVDTGTPAGTSGSPWLVKLSGGLDSLFAAINASGLAGDDYSTVLTQNPDVKAMNNTATKLFIRASRAGPVGNNIVTTTTSANFAWEEGGLMVDGGDPSWYPIAMPDDAGVISCAVISSHVVVVPAQGEGINGRFYWIEPGELEVDPLNFATAERSPDPISGVVVFGDQFWLPGLSTVEPWYFTGNPDAPVQRMQGVVFDRGAWPGTAIQVKDGMFIVSEEGAVYQVQGGTKRVSTPDIEERIRKAIQRQRALT